VARVLDTVQQESDPTQCRVTNNPLPDAVLSGHLVPGADHYLPLRTPEVLADLLLSRWPSPVPGT
jgi:hypothetical protein